MKKDESMTKEVLLNSMIKRIDKVEKKSDDRLKNYDEAIQMFHSASIEVKTIAKNQSIIFKLLRTIVESEKLKKENNKFHENVLLWIITTVITVAISAVLISSNPMLLTFLEKVSSIITSLLVFCGGMYSSFKISTLDKLASKAFAVSFSVLSVCYFAYVLKDFGSFYPEVAAIGFNTATILIVSSTIYLSSIFFKKSEESKLEADEEYTNAK